MIWYVCYVLAIILFGMTIVRILDSSKGQGRFAGAILLFFAMAYVLYIPVFFSQYDPIAALFADLLNLFQMITLDADYLGFYDEVSEGISLVFIRKLYFLTLGFAHVLMPLAALFAAFTVILHYLSDIGLFLINRRKSAVHIFSEFNEKSLALATDIHAREPKSDIIFEKTSDDDKHNDVRSALHCMFRFDTIAECSVKMKEGRKVYFYCMSESDEENLDASLSLVSKYSGEPECIQQNISIMVFSEEHDVESMLDSVDKKLLNVILVRESYNCIYNLLDQYPLYSSMKNNTISVLIYGYGKLGKAMLKSAAWAGQMLPDCRLEINVVGVNLKDAEAETKVEAPGLFADKYHIRFHDCTSAAECVEVIRRECRRTTYALVCGNLDSENIRSAAMLRREFYIMDPEFRNEPPIFVYVSKREKYDSVRNMKTPEARDDRKRSYNLIPFGDIKSIYTCENLSDSNLEKLAFNVHLVYSFDDTAKERSVEELTDARRSYNTFEINKESSRANALHIRYKLWLLGLDYTDDKNAKEVDFKDFLTEDKLHQLTLAEHDRWEAYQVSQGWVTCSLDQVKAYQSVNLSGGRHNCPLLKLHPYICPFEELEGRSKALNLPDARFLDVKMIECIPLVLHDNWEAGGKKFKIVKNV